MAKEWQNILDEFSGSKSSSSTNNSGSSSPSSSGSSKTQNNSNNWQRVLDDFSGSRKQAYADYSNSVAQRVITRAQKKKKEEEEKKKKERSWLKKGNDNIGKTILGTGADIFEDITAGILGMGEKAVDALAMLAPYASNAQLHMDGPVSPEIEKQYKDLQDDAKKEIGKFVAKDLYDEGAVARQILSGFGSASYVDSKIQTGGYMTAEDLKRAEELKKPVLNYLENDMEQDSVLGEKADELVQSAGQLAGQFGLSMVGVPWFVTSGVTSFGAESENALNQGASFEEATGSAAISAGSEILSEKLFGGDLFVGKSGSDLATKYLSGNISNKAWRTFLKWGGDAVGEGVEEIFSQFMSNLGTSLYREENLGEILFSEQALEEYLDSFFGGVGLGGAMGGINVAQSKKAGVDFASGLTANEQKVVQKELENRLAEKDGKVTAKQKAKIYEEVVRDMERGYLSIDTIEEVLGGEKYSQYKQAAEWEDSLQTEFDKLNKMKQGQMTGEQVDRREALRTQLKNVKATSTLTQQRTQIRDEVMGLVKGDRLAESYNERARTGQKFEADVTKYDAKQQAVVQKAIDSGILNNSNRTHEFVDFVSKISADTGVLFDFSNTAKIREAGFAVEGQTVDGFITKDGITVNIDSPKSRQFVVGHEITHALEGTELYDALRKTVFDYAKMKNQYGVRMESIQKRYKEGTDFEAELTADLVGEYIFSDTDFINSLSTQNRNVFQKVFDEIKYLCKVATAGSKEARELEKVKRAFEKAYREGGKAQGDTKYSVSDSAGKELTVEQQEYFKDSKARDENGNLIKVYHSSPTAGFTVFDGSEGEGNYKYGDYGDGITFFTDNKAMADSYSPSSEKVDTTKLNTIEEAQEWLESLGFTDLDIKEKNGQYKIIDYDEGMVMDFESEEHLLRDLKRTIQEEYGDTHAGGQYEGYLNIKNPMVVDAEGRPWDRAFEGFSQELYDQMREDFTEEEKAALIDLAGWEDFGTFKDEVSRAVRDVGKPTADDYTRLLDSAFWKCSDFNALFDMAADGFSDESIRRNAIISQTTNDLVEEALQDGSYDGVIIKNVIDYGGHAHATLNSPPGNDYIVFNSNQFKAADNLKPTDDEDIRYSLSDSNGRELSKEQSVYFKDSKVRDENGSLKVMYHGTPNGEFTIFRDGTYFTDSKEYADRYQNPSASSISTGKVASAPKTFEVYLDIKKPFDINDAEARNIYINNYIKGGNAMGINPYMSDAEYAKINSIDWTEGEDLREFLIENEYDYDGLVLDEGATGGYGEEVKSRGKSYVVFSPEQVKNVDNLKPSSNPDIRFSLSNPVEETKDLMAVHNLTAEQVLKSLELGGLPMPSIAVLKADSVHDEYGDVSLILPKDAIDPKKNKANKVYGGDAWTPVYPRIEYKPSEAVEKKISDKYYGLAREIGYDAVRPLYNYVTDLERQLNNANGETAMLEKLYDDTDMMNLYLQDSGKGKVEPIRKETVTKITEAEAEMNQFFIDALGKDVIESVWCPKGVHPAEHRKAFMAQNKTAIEDAYKRFCMEEFNFTEEGAENVVVNTSQRDLITFVRNAARYIQNNGVTVKTEIDSQATQEAIRTAAADGYKEWVDGLFKGVEEKTGIRNNQDYYTRSGNPRSWDVLHWENTLENVVKVMKGQEETGTGSMSPYNSFASLAHKRYGSIAEIKADSNRLGKISQDEYEALGESFGNRFAGIAESIKDPAERNPFIALDNAAETIVDAVRTQKTKAGMLSYLQKWNKRVTQQTVDDVVALVNDIANMPTGYFEAKPQRAVSFEEVGVFVIPYDADVKLKQELLNKGYSIAEYDPKVEGDRQRVVNQFEEYKFSLSNVGEQHTPDSLSAMRMDVPTADEYSEVAPVDDNLLATVSETESVREMFPDDGVAEQDELDNLIAEEAEIRGVMEAYAGVGDIEAVNKLLPEHEALRDRIKELQQHETERADSLTDADVPAEMDAPLSMKSENYDPWSNTSIYDIDRSTRTSSDRNPGARRFLEEAALGFGYDVNNSTHGEKWYNDELYYSSGGEQGFGGTTRHTTSDIEELKDAYGYTWEQLRKAADDVAKGEVRSVAAKRVELLCHKRLMEGYTDVDGRRYEPNQEYITFLNETFANEQRAESFGSLLAEADQYAPTAEDIAPVKESLKPASTKLKDIFSENDAPIYDGKDGQTTMFAPEKPKTSGKVGKVLTKPSKPEAHTNIAMKAANLVVDKGQAVENLSLKTGNHELQAKYNYALGSNTEAMAQYFMKNGAEGVKAYENIVSEIIKSGKRNAFEDYLGHALNTDRMSLEARFGTPNKAVYGDSVTAEMSQKTMAEYEANNPEFKQWAEDIYSIMRYCRNMLVEGNLASQETADLWEQQYPHYVPIERVDKKGAGIKVPLDTTKTGVNAPIMRATGDNSYIEPFLNTIAKRIEQTYRAVARNSFGIELKNTLGNTTVDSQSNNSSVDSLIDLIDDQDSQLLKPGSLLSNPTFTVFENGERVEFEITEELFDALKPAGVLGYRNKVIGKVGDIRRNLLTNWNTKFSLWRNPQKDAKEVFLNSQHPLKTYMNMYVPYKDNALIQILTKGEYAQEYHKNGGESVTYYDRGKNDFVKEDGIAKKIVKNTVGVPFRAVMRAGEIIEEIPRLAEYTASRKEGRSVERSMLDAARVTTNFAAGGDLTKFANAHGCTFLNASVQGAAQHVRNFREGYNKEGVVGLTKVLGKYVLSGIPALVFNHLVWDDDEDYEELNDYVKENYIVIAKTDEGKFIRIPKGRTEAVMNEAIQQVMNMVTGNDEVDLSTLNELFWNNIAPNNPRENNIIAPIRQAFNNEAWYGDEIVPSRLQDLPTEEQFDESTDAFSKWLGEHFDPFELGPYRINYLLDQYSGGIGDTLLPMATPEAESGDNTLAGNLLAPWKKELTTDSVLNNKNPGNFYELKDELEVKSNGKNATDEDKMRSMYLDSVSWEMGDLYAQKREIQSSNLSDDQKYAKVREIQEQINELANNALDKYNHVRINGAYSEAGDRRYNYDADKDKWYEIKPTNSDGSDNWYYQKEQEVTKGLGISYEQYWNNREEYNFAYDKPGKYAIAQAVGGYDSYMEHYDVLENWQSDKYISADKDSQGNSISGSRKKKVQEYINSLDLDYGEKIILYRTVYESKADKRAYNNDIIDYLNSRDDISYQEMESILLELGFNVDSKGNISW